MTNPDLPILIVDDARLSQAVMSRALVRAGYQDIRQCHNAEDAINALKERQAGLVIADWLMPDIDGFELLSQIRQQDEINNHFTFMLMVTGQEGQEALETAFVRGVDDFIFKSALSAELIPRTAAGARVSDQVNQLLADNQRLLQYNHTLEQRAFIDPELGFGNARYAEHMLSDMLSHIQGRGGVLCVVLLDIITLRALRKSHSADVIYELSHSFCRRFKQQIRAMDHLCTLGNDEILLISLRSSIDQVDTSQFRRLSEKLTNKSYQTSAGFMNVELRLSVLVFEPKHLLSTPTFEETTRALHKLVHAGDNNSVRLESWPLSK
jgi:PleD family two-component response regulator